MKVVPGMFEMQYQVVKKNIHGRLTPVLEGVGLYIWYQIKGCYSDSRFVKLYNPSSNRFPEIKTLVRVCGAVGNRAADMRELRGMKARENEIPILRRFQR